MEMRDAHLTADEIGHFLDKGDQLINRLFLHHLAVCPGCYAVAGHVLDLYQAGETRIEGLGSIEISLALSRKGAPALLENLNRRSRSSEMRSHSRRSMRSPGSASASPITTSTALPKPAASSRRSPFPRT